MTAGAAPGVAAGTALPRNDGQADGSTRAERHGGHRVAEVLHAAGVTVVFTLCGGHISPILAAARMRGLRIVDVRDEASAVFAADAHARLTGRPGVAAVTAGPGLTNTLTALKNAQLAQSPVVLLCGAAPTALQGRGALQDIAQRPLAAPLVKRYFAARRVRDLGEQVAEALQLAAQGLPGPVAVECPVDLLYEPAQIREWYAEAAGHGTALADRALRWYLNRHARRMLAGADDPRVPAVPVPVAPEAAAGAIGRAAQALSRARQPLMVIGSQALLRGPQAADRLAEAVGRLGVPVYLSGMARGLLGRDHPLQMRHQRRQALREADCVLLAGVPCDFRLDYGRHVRRSATLIAANRSAREARLNRRPDVAAIGDAALTLQALAGQVSPDAAWRPWAEALRQRDAAREAEIATQAARPGAHVNPLALLREVERQAAESAVFIADGGDFVATASYMLRPRSPLSWLDPGAFGTLGVGAGFAIGAGVARPGAERWLIWGDGACGFSIAEFDSLARQGLPVIALVGNDAGWTQIAREQVKMLGDDVATVLARSDYHRVAEGFGGAGLRITAASEVAPVLAEARRLAAEGRPVLVNAWLDGTDFREGSLSM